MPKKTSTLSVQLPEDLDAELRKLRFEVEQLKDKLKEANAKVRAERRRADQHADEVTTLRDIEAAYARRRMNGGAA